MARQTPGKYKKRASHMRKAARSQRLRRAREKKIREQNAKRREKGYTTIYFASVDPSPCPLLESENFAVSSFFENPFPELPVMAPPLRSPLGRRGKMRVAKVFNKISTSAPLSKNVTIANLCISPTLSVSPGWRENASVTRVLRKLSANALLGRNVAIPKVFKNSSLGALIGKKGQLTVACVFDGPSACSLLGKNLTIPKALNNPSLSALLRRKESMTVACIIDKPPKTLLGRNEQAIVAFLGAPLDKSKNAVVASVIDKPSEREEKEKGKNVALSRLTKQVVRFSNKATMTEEITVNNPVPMLIETKIVMDVPVSMPVEPKTGIDFSMENPMYNVSNSAFLISPLDKSESVTLSNVSNSTSSTSPVDIIENATLSIVSNSNSASAPLDKSENVTPSNVSNSTSFTAPLDNSENLTLSEVLNSISSPLKEIQNLTVGNAIDKSFPNLSPDDGTLQDQQHEDQISQATSDSASTKVPEQASDPKASLKNSKVTKHCLCCRKASASDASLDLNQVSLSQITMPREISDEQQLEMRHNIERAENKFPGGRFICDLKSVIRQARDIEAHSSKCKYGGSLIYYRMTKEGLVHTFYYSCSNPVCDTSVKLVTDNGGESLNRLAVLGSSSTGSGFSQEKEKFRVMNLQYMNKSMYSQYDRLAGQVVRFSSKATMTEEITVSNPVPVSIEPKIVMDFSVENPVSMPVEPQPGMDFSVENTVFMPVEPRTRMGCSVSIPVEPKTGMGFSVENPISIPSELKTGMGFSMENPVSIPVELKSGMDFSVENPIPTLVEPKIEMDFYVENPMSVPVEPKTEMDFSIDNTTPMPVEPKSGMDFSVDNPVPMLVQPKIEIDFHVDETW